MKTLRWILTVFSLTAITGSAIAQTLAHPMVEDIGTPLNVELPEMIADWADHVAISPDGQWLAYAGPFNIARCIYIVPTTGGEATVLYRYDQFVEQFKDDPVWDALERIGNVIWYITFTPDSQEVTFEIHIYDTDLGSTIEFTYDEHGYYSSCSLENPVRFIKSVNIYSGEVRELVIGGRYPNWDPTGRYLLYTNSDYRRYIDGLEPENDGLQIVLDTLTGESWVLHNEFVSDPVVLPEEGYVIFNKGIEEEVELINGDWRHTTTGVSYLYRCPLSGGEAEQLTHTCDNLIQTYDHVVSHDEKWLFFTNWTNIWRAVDFQRDDDPLTSGGFGGVAQGISVLNLETGKGYDIIPPSENLDCSPLSVSPDGTTLYVYIVDYYLRNTKYIGEDGKKHDCRSNFVVAIDFDPQNPGTPFVTAVEDATPAAFPALTSYPNPFNPSTSISFTLPETGFTELAVFNIMGQKIRTLVAGELSSGVHEVVWDGCDDSGNPVSSGIFVSRLVAGDTVVTNRMTLVK